MGDKEKIDPDSIPKYKNTVSQNLEAIRQIQKKVDQAFSKSSATQFNKYDQELKEKNSYFAKSKIPDINKQDQAEQNLKITNKFKGLTNLLNEEENDYCQKCPSLKNHCPHKNKKEQIKDKYTYPILSNSTYGWLPPVDDLKENHNIKSVTKSFYDNSHL
jgi:hypothetical protein